MMNPTKKISVITIVYNRVNDIQKTIESVVNQTFNSIEYIIIDGASTDGTLDILNRNASKIDILISEKDAGIYDAMNKGLQVATGEFVLFMNAGDSFYNLNVLQNIFEQLTTDADIIYGDTMFVDMNDKELGLMSQIRKRVLVNNLSWKSMQYGMMFCHQSFLVKKSIAPKYEVAYRYSADIDWIIKCMKQSHSNYFYSLQPIANFQIGGASLQNQRQSLIERFSVLAKHFGFIKTFFAHVLIALKLK